MKTSELNVIQTRVSGACSGGASVGKDDVQGSCILEIVVAILLAIFDERQHSVVAMYCLLD